MEEAERFVHTKTAAKLDKRIAKSDSTFHLVLLISTALLVAGFWSATSYQLTPGEHVMAPAEWPAAAPLEFEYGKLNLIMFAHPKCPCTRASLWELEKIVSRSHEKMTSSVFFLKPDQVSEGWEKTDLWRTARSIPGVKTIVDRDGEAAKVFHATTSGFVVVYGADGRLLFQGGITGSRGHAGDNNGQMAVESLVLGKGSESLKNTQVFGCPLKDEIAPSAAGADDACGKCESERQDAGNSSTLSVKKRAGRST